MLVRLIPLPLHGAIEFAVGLTIALVPILIGATAVSATIAFAVGALIMGAATGATISDTPGGRFSATWHAAFDQITAGFMLVLAIAAALAGDVLAGTFFFAAALALIALIATTRYSTGHKLPAQIK